MRKLILLALMFCAASIACNDDDDSDATGYVVSGANQRVKRISGEYSAWGKFQLEFSYGHDGRLQEGWRVNPETGDTTGRVTVTYDQGVHKMTFLDYLPGFDEKTIAELKQKYPDTYRDSLKRKRSEQTLCSVELDADGNMTKIVSRPRRDLGGNESGDVYNTTYVKVSNRKQIPELANGKLTVIRCFDNEYGMGGTNSSIENRILSKYEFTYDGNTLLSGGRYFPDTYSETSWRKVLDFGFESYSGVVVDVDSEVYKMRRSANRVVVAEPGVNYTYTLNDEGLAVSLEMSTGDHFTFEYERGSGNFYELYAMPLDRVLGSVWVK